MRAAASAWPARWGPTAAAPCRSPSCLQSARLLSIVWGGALIGVSQCVVFSHAPKVLAASLYVALGWAALPFVQRFSDVLPAVDVALVVVGGVVYSLGVRHVWGCCLCVAGCGCAEQWLGGQAGAWPAALRAEQSAAGEA